MQRGRGGACWLCGDLLLVTYTTEEFVWVVVTVGGSLRSLKLL